ncbi:hypothetical protein [Streptomyces coeruleorubidus]|uniref:hypothetical protein n=1 Tax=Streptomyces coeruleorubidus TaxID=116188 RepID=UPI00365F06B4
MPSGESWYVLVEENGYHGIGDDFSVSEVEYVDGGRARAREMALEIAKKYPDSTRYADYQRSVFRIDENALIVVLRKDRRKASFRVTVGELVHTEEAAVEVDAQEPDTGEGVLRRAFRKKK